MASYKFKCSPVDMSVKEFYLNYNKLLPKLIKITQGYCGEVVLDTFDRDQVFRIHTYSVQKRVVAKLIGGCRLTGVDGTQLSIPIDYNAKFCLIKPGDKIGKEENLQDIINKYKLPVDVQFGKSVVETVRVGDVERSTGPTAAGHRFRIALLDTYEENFLLGNAVLETSLYGKVTAVPIYLPDLRLSLITGFQSLPQVKYDAAFRQMTSQVEKNITFDTSLGNEDIAVYSGQLTGHDIYSYVSPSNYCHMDNGMARGRKKSSRSAYEDLQIHNVVANVYDIIPHDQMITEEPPESVYNEYQAPATVKVAPPKPPKPTKRPKPSPKLPPETEIKTESEKDAAPPVSIREGGCQYSSARKIPHNNDVTTPDETLDAPVVPPIPLVELMHAQSSVMIKPPPSDELIVKCLSVDELAEWMTKIKLGKYTEDFQDQMIDGAILIDLDVSILKEEFGMLGYEAVKLMKFANEGHVPKTR